jgi:type IV pilus assembly protein PilP
MRTTFLVPVVFAYAAVVAAAQTPSAAAPTPASPGPGAATAAPATPSASSSDGYTYQPDGRRDPFMNLLGIGTETRPTGRRADGAAGLTVAEISVNGVLESRGSLIAMIQGPDRKSYIVHAGDRFLDGTIRSITPQGLTIVQEVNDPLSLVKQREIQKLLRSLESAKE